jgi:hypothetical protein
MTQAILTPEADRLSQLRARTDRQIVDFIATKLDSATKLAARADSEFESGARLAAQHSLSAADRALGEAQKLLLALPEPRRRDLDSRIADAMEAIARVCADRDLLRPLFVIGRAPLRASR